MSVFKRKKTEVSLVEVSHFDRYSDAKEYFEGKYGFIGDQLVSSALRRDCSRSPPR